MVLQWGRLQESYCGGQHLILGLMGLVLNFNHAECQYRPFKESQRAPTLLCPNINSDDVQVTDLCTSTSFSAPVAFYSSVQSPDPVRSCTLVCFKLLR